MSEGRAKLKRVMEPGETWTHWSKLTHQFNARDVRVDDWRGSPGRHKMTTNSSLGSWKIGVETSDLDGSSSPIREDGSVVVDVPGASCVDLSGHCGFWAGQDQCRQNPNFMKERCALTCGECSREERRTSCSNSDGDGGGGSCEE